MSQLMLLLPGDGIGPEVTGVSRRLLEYLIGRGALHVRLEERRLGGAALESAGVPVEPETMELAQGARAVLMGAVGDSRWEDQAIDRRPEAAILQLRNHMKVFANLRPIRCYPALANSSSLKPELVSGLDILFVRELLGGVYFGKPRGISRLPDGQRLGTNTHTYTTNQIRRVVDVAFRIARERSHHVCSVEKSNVMEAGLLWREETQALRDELYPDVHLTHMLADNCAMQLVRCPKQFDVIVTDNLFGDLLSDAAATLTGSLGMLPSAAIGEKRGQGLYEPVHGSAPDITGQGIANPCASVLSVAMAMRFSFERPDLASAIDAAVGAAIEKGVRTRDIGGTATTEQMGEAILSCLSI